MLLVDSHFLLIVASCFRLAQLHMSEQKTAHEFAELGLALPSSTAHHAQADQVDTLDAQIAVTHYPLAIHSLFAHYPLTTRS